MKCAKCAAPLDYNSRFCSACGADVSASNKVISQKNLSAVWLRELFAAEGYKISQIEGDTFSAQHAENPNLTVDYRSGIDLIVFTSWWTLSKPPSFLQAGAFREAVRLANEETVVCKCSATPKGDALRTQFTMYVCSQTMAFDILRMVMTFSQATRQVLNRADIQKFA